MSFYALEIARTGLMANQKAIEITGHNIANANTEGYTRQRLELSSKSGGMGTKFDVNASAMVGGGVSIDQISQLRDKYLDSRFRNANAYSSELEMRNSSLEYIEGIFSEPSEHGISSAISDLFNSFDELNKSAHDQSVRGIVYQNAVKMTDAFHSISSEILKFQEQTNINVGLKVDEMNSLADQISEINETIFKFEVTGQQANDLRDQRNILVDELSKIMSISTEETQDGKFRVNIGGISLVDHNKVNYIETRSTSLNPYTGEMMNEVYWADAGNKVNLATGELKGMIDVVFGNTDINQGTPYYMDKLNNLAGSLVEKFNEVNNAGYTIPYGGNPSSTGVDFFDSTKTSAIDISVSDALEISIYNIAASSVEIIDDTQWGNNENSMNFSELRNVKDIVYNGENIGNAEEYFQKTISELAITTGYYSNRAGNQRILTNHMENERLSVSEVSVDEEMANLVRFQQTYAASAKYISVVDEMLQILLGM